ncbi:MAG: AI-2E family transporter [Acetobacteraceae bacterium]|nr:AI-2E family transporter [Acetobacteraceae bacterium]
MPTAPSNVTRLSNRVQPADAPGVNGLLGLAVGVVIVAALYLAREVLIPITLAVLLSFVLAPVVALLRRANLPRVPAVVLAALLALGVVIVLGGVIGTQVADLAGDIPRYASTVEKKVTVVRTFTVDHISALTKRLDHIGPPAQSAPTPAAPAAGPPAAQPPIPVEVHQPDPSPLEVAEQIVGPMISPLATMGIVFVVAVFMLMQREDLRDRLIRLFGSSDLHRTTAALDDAAYRLSRYFLTQVCINAGFGLVIGAGLFLIGVPNPILWGILAGLLRFVPYVGAFGGAVLPVVLAAAVDPGWTKVVETVALFLVVEPVLGQVVEPLAYGHSTGLSPVSVIISAIFWGWLWGPVGLILSTPLTLCLVVMGRHIERLEFIEVLLGDRPALTPAESLYQRMLAGDADEALDQAEALLKDKPLSAYYDEVAVPGLQLAANDSLRGVLTPDQLRGILDSVSGVVVDLAEEKDGSVPDDLDPAWTGESAVLCVSGRGPLDEAVCAMMAQILGKRGLRARVISQDAVSRAHIPSLDVTGVRLVCISYIEGANSVSPLRYLTRRLRQRAPDATVLIGLWGADPALLIDERIRAAVGGDLYVNSLRDAVDACLAAARQPQERPEMAA